ncbi:MAG: AAA family ATPase, partial [Flavobacteriaceae bacterium]|nr:AAA family ATPase [Flavobacteriaceae bacterium]
INDKNPYKGLAAFKVEDGEYFFGRESELNECLKKIVTSDNNIFISVIGSSGTGKSSFVQAGLLYRLSKWEKFGLSDSVICIVRPGNTPFTNLIYQLKLKRLSSSKIENQSISTNLILYFDQFEEIITQCHSPQSKAEVKDLFQFLDKLTLTNSPEYQILVITSFRSDYLSELANFDFIKSHQIYFPLSSLDYRVNSENWANSIRDIITKPAELNGVEIENELVDQLLTQLMDVSGSLPILQFALTKLWVASGGSNRSISSTDFSKVSKGRGIAGIIEQHADNVVKLITTNGNNKVKTNIVKSIFVNLVQVNENQNDIRRSLKKDELLELLAIYPKQDVNDVMDILLSEKSRLISETETGDGSFLVTLIHEVLIRKWDLLKEWINERREALQQRKLILLDLEAHRNGQRSPYSGIQLSRTIRWKEENPDLTNPAIDEFINVSKRKKQKFDNLKKIIAAATIIILLGFGYFILQSLNKEEAKKYYIAAEKIRETDPTIALRLIESALKLDNNKEYREKAVHLAGDHSFYKDIFEDSDGEFISRFSSDGTLVAIGYRDGRVVLLNNNGKLLKTIQVPVRDKLGRLAISKNNESIYVGDVSGNNYLASLKGNSIFTLEKTAPPNIELQWIFEQDLPDFIQNDSLIYIQREPRNGNPIILSVNGPKQNVNLSEYLLFNQDSLRSLEEDQLHVFDSPAIMFSPNGTKMYLLNNNLLASLYAYDVYSKEWRYRYSYNYTPQFNSLIVQDNIYGFDKGYTDNFARRSPNDYPVSISNDGLTVLTRNLGSSSPIYAVSSPLYSIYKFTDYELISENGELDEYLRNIGHHKEFVDKIDLPSVDSDIVKWAFSTDSKKFLTGHLNGEVSLWNIEGQLLQEFRGHKDRIVDLAFAPLNTILSVSADGKIKRWDLNTDSFTSLTHRNAPDFKYLLKNYDDFLGIDTLQIKINPEEFMVVLGYEEKDLHPELLSADISPDGFHITTLYNDYTLKLWTNKGELLWTKENCNTVFDDYGYELNTIRFSRNGSKIIATKRDDFSEPFIIWDKLIGKADGFVDEILWDEDYNYYAFSEDNKKVAFGNKEGLISIHELDSKDNQKIISDVPIEVLEFNEDGTSLFAQTESDTILFFHFQRDSFTKKQIVHEDLEGMEVSKDGTKVLTWSKRDGSGRDIAYWNITPNSMDSIRRNIKNSFAYLSGNGDFVAVYSTINSRETKIKFTLYDNKLNTIKQFSQVNYAGDPFFKYNDNLILYREESGALIWYNLEKNEIVRKYRGPQSKLKGLKMRLSENGEDMILFGPNDVDVVKIKTYQDYFKSPYVQELAKDELALYLN